MITAADIYTLFRPYPCRRRVYLRSNKPELAAPPSEYDKLIITLGQEHEQLQLSRFPGAIRPKYPIGDLRAGAKATHNLILQKAPVIYQGVVCSEDSSVAGIPDFLICKGDSYIICDAKLATNLESHPEIPIQLSLYAQTFADYLGMKPLGLEVILGDGTVETIASTDTSAVLQEIRSIQQSTIEPDEAVGWSKCQGCSFGEYCWNKAEKKFDPGIIFGIDQGLRNELISMGVSTYHQLAEMQIGSLTELLRPWGRGRRKVGNRLAEKILRQIQSIVSSEKMVFNDFELPPSGPCVYFDIEADPHDEMLVNKVYLWGILVDRKNGSQPEYWGEIAGEAQEADKEGWFHFLFYVEKIFREFGEIPFVHYATYEKTWLSKYIERWGDHNGVAENILDLLWDMHSRTIMPAICLPVPSYGLKLVEKEAGFQRSQDDFGSQWSIVQYHKCIKTDSELERQRISEELLRYNREDCEAMRHVLKWLKQLQYQED